LPYGRWDTCPAGLGRGTEDYGGLVGSCPTGLGGGIEDYGGLVRLAINALLVKRGSLVGIGSN